MMKKEPLASADNSDNPISSSSSTQDDFSQAHSNKGRSFTSIRRSSLRKAENQVNKSASGESGSSDHFKKQNRVSFIRSNSIKDANNSFSGLMLSRSKEIDAVLDLELNDLNSNILSLEDGHEQVQQGTHA
jgi:lipopolysaccharide export LptBFGC system permease protein LptF